MVGKPNISQGKPIAPQGAAGLLAQSQAPPPPKSQVPPPKVKASHIPPPLEPTRPAASTAKPSPTPPALPAANGGRAADKGAAAQGTTFGNAPPKSTAPRQYNMEYLPSLEGGALMMKPIMVPLPQETPAQAKIRQIQSQETQAGDLQGGLTPPPRQILGPRSVILQMLESLQKGGGLPMNSPSGYES